MASGNVAPQRHSKTESEIRTVSVDLRSFLDTSELLAGAPTVTEVDTIDLTLSAKALNTSALVINGATCAPGQAVQFLVAGGVAGTTYSIRVLVSTNATAPQTIEVVLVLRVVAD